MRFESHAERMGEIKREAQMFGWKAARLETTWKKQT